MKCDVLVHKLDKLKMCCLLIPDTILIAMNDGQEKGRYNQRILVTVNNSINWQAGVVAFGDGFGYITISKVRMKELDIREGDTVQIELEKDTSEFGHEFPVELGVLFEQDIEAKSRFFNLSPGFQRTIIYYILQAKSSDKRIEKSVFFMHNLKLTPIGKETMRMIFGKFD